MLDKNLIPETIPFDFDDNYAAVKQKFADYGYDTQEGSNTMQLAIAMSYLTSMLNANTAVNINEMLLPLARKRKNALQGARLLGYEIRHTLSYKYKLTLEFPEGMHRINRYEKFEFGGKKYYYMGDNIVSFEGPTTINIEVAEGDLKEWRNDNSLITNLSVSASGNTLTSDYYVDVPYKNVAENGLRVFVTYVEPSGSTYELLEYPRMDNFVIDANSKGKSGYVRLDNLEFKTPRIYFKLGNVGLDLPENTRVFVDALVSSGLDGKMENVTPDKISTDLDCVITSVLLTSSGADEEDIESIRSNAVLFHNSANRLVTKEDYRGFINRDARVESSVVWDGGDEYPYRPGNIWYSALPNHTQRSFSVNDTNTIWNLENKGDLYNWSLTPGDISNINQSMDGARIPTLSVHHRNPVYMDFDYKIQIVRYSRSQTLSEWNNKVFDVIDQYFIDSAAAPGAERYAFEYFQSSLIKRIDAILSDVTGFNIELRSSITLTKDNLLNETLNMCTNPGGEFSRLDSNKNQLRFHLATPFEKYIDELPEGEIQVLTEYLPSISCEVCSIGGLYLEVDFDNPVKLGKRVVQYQVNLEGVRVGEYRVFLDAAETIEVVLFCTPRDMEPMDPEATEQEHKIWDRLQSGLRVNIRYNSPNFKVSRNTIPNLNSVEFINR